MGDVAALPAAAIDRLRCHLRSRLGPALLALTALLLCGVYQVRLGHTVHVGVLTDDKPYVAEMHGPEQHPAGPYRWTTAESEIRLPGQGRGPYQLTLHLAGSANPQPNVKVAINGRPLADFDPAPDFREYTFDVPASMTGGGDLIVTLESRLFQPPNDRRQLGVALDRVAVTPTGDPGLQPPPPAQALRVLALVALAYLLAALAGFGPRGATVFGAGVATGLAGLLLVNRPWLTIWTDELLAAAAAGTALASILRLALPPLYRLAGLRIGPDERRWPAALAAIFFVVHLGGDLHPHTNIVDINFHANRYRAVHEGGELLLRVESREWGTRKTIYPPTAYLAMRPLRPLAPDLLTTIMLFMTLAEATRLCLVYLVARRATGDGRAGVFAATLFGIVPMAYLPFSWGIATNVFGAWWITAIFALLALGYDALRRPAVAALATAIATLALLSHPGEFVLAAATLGGAIVLFGVAIRPRFRGGWPVLVGVTVLAGGVAFAILYRHVAAEMLAQGWETVQTKLRGGGQTSGPGAAAPVPRGWRVGGAIDDPIIGLKGYRVTTVSDLIAGGLLGFWREAVGYYCLWPPLFALAGLWLMRGTKDLARLRLASILWWGVATIFALAGLLLNVYVRYALYLLPPIAIGAGLVLARLSRTGRWGRAVVATLLVLTTGAGLWFWYLRISVDGH